MKGIDNEREAQKVESWNRYQAQKENQPLNIPEN